MANHTYDGAVDGVLDTAGNWDAIPDAVEGVLIFDAVQNAPNGYADGTAPATAMTIDGTWGLSLLAGADLDLSEILGDLGNQVVVNVTLVTGSDYDHDATEEITGDVSLNASTMFVTANADIAGTVGLAATSSFTYGSTGTITGAVTVNASIMTVDGATADLGSTVDLVGSTFNYSSTGAITGAVTVDATSAYNANSDHTLTGGITVTGGDLVVATTKTLTSGVILASASTLTLTGSGAVVGAVTTTANASITMGDGSSITGSLDADDDTVTWSNTGTNTLTVNATSDLVLGGAATGLDIDIDAAGNTVTAGAAISINDFTLTAATSYAGGAHAHTIAGSYLYTAGTMTATGTWKFTGTGTITAMPALTSLDLEVDTAGTITLAGNMSVQTLTVTAGTYACGAYTHTVAGNVVYTAGTVTGTGLLTINTTANLDWTAPTMPITLNGGATTVTATGPVSCSLLTVSSAGGTYAAGAQAHTFSAGFVQTAATVTATGVWTLTGTGPLTLTDALVGLDIIVDATGATITVGAPLSVEGLTITDVTTYAAGAHAHTSATDFILTSGAVTATGTWTMTGTGNLAMVSTAMVLVVNTAGTITATGPVSVKTLTLTTGTLALGAQPVTVAGTVLQSAGTITSTGLWTMSATGTVTITDAIAGAYFNVAAGTTTLGGNLSIAGLQIQDGAIFDADSNSLVLAVGRITGYGTLTNLTPAGIIHVAPGVADGGGNDANVIFDTVAFPIVV